MSAEIKGLYLEIGGDTTKLSAALKNTEKNITALVKELGQVEYGLNFEPKSLVLLEQKAALTQKEIDNLIDKLNKLKAAEEQASPNKDKSEVDAENFRLLQREIVKTESQLLKCADSLNDTKKVIDQNGEAYQQQRQQAENALDAIKTGAGTAKSEIVNLGDEVNSLGGKIEETGNKASVFGDVLKANFAGDMIRQGLDAALKFAEDGASMYRDMTEAQSKLQLVMKNTMGAAKDEADSIVKLTGTYEKMGVVSKTVQLAGAQELSTYLTKKETLEKLIPVMNDMLAQQYGINATQQNAANIATMLGKVMDGQVGALKRYGYAFDELQEEILKSGTESERAAVLFDVVTSSVGGMNEELGKTDLGKYAQQSAELAEKQAAVGKAFQDATVALKSGMLPAVSGIADLFTSLPEGIQKTVVACGLLATAGIALNSAFGPVGLIIAGVGAAAIAIGGQIHKGISEEAEKASAKMRELGDAAASVVNKDMSIDVLAAKFKILKTSIDSGKLSADELKSAYEQLKEVKRQLIELSGGVITANDLEKKSFQDVVDAIKEMTDNEKQIRLSEISAELYKDSAENLKSLRDSLQATQNEYVNQLEGATNLNLGLKALSDEITALHYAYYDGSVTLEEYQKHQQDIIKRANELTGANYDVADGFARIKEDSADASAAYDKLKKSIDDNANALKTAEEKYQNYIKLQSEHNKLAASMSDEEQKRQAAIALTAAKFELQNAQAEAFISNLRLQNSLMKDATANLVEMAGETKDLESAQETLAKKQSLSREQLLGLISTYPELAKYIAENNDLTFKNGEVIRDLMETRRLAAIDAAKKQAEETQNAVNNAKTRIEAIQAEMRAISAKAGYNLGAARIQQSPLLKEMAELNTSIKEGEEDVAKYLATVKALETTASASVGGSGKTAAKAVKSEVDTALAALDHLKKTSEVSTEDELTEIQRILSECKMSADERMKLEEQVYALKKSLGDEEKKDTKKNTEDMEKAIIAYGDGVAEAMKRQKREEINVAKEAMQKQIDLLNDLQYKEITTNKDITNTKISLLSDEYTAKVKGIDAGLDAYMEASGKEIQRHIDIIALTDTKAAAELQAIKDRMDAIDAESKAEKDAISAREQAERTAELNKRIMEAETDEERKKAMDDLAKYEEDLAYKSREAKRAAEKKELEDQKKAVIDAAKEKVAGEAEVIKGINKNQTEKIKDAQADLKEGDKEKGITGLKDLEEAYKDFEKTAAKAAAELVASGEEGQKEALKILQEFYPEWEERGKNFLDFMTEGLSENKEHFVDTAVKIGMDTSSGLAKGLDAAAYLVQESAEDLAEIIKRTVAAALNIGSPSRVMRELGKFAGMGLSLGLGDTVSMVKAAARKLGIASVPDIETGRGVNGAYRGRGSGGVSVTVNNNIYSQPDKNMLYQLDLQAKRDGNRIARMVGANGGTLV